MITPLFLSTLCLFFTVSYLQRPHEKVIVGVWKHQKFDIFFKFSHDNSMLIKIPTLQGTCEISGKYNMLNRNLLKIELDYQYGAISGEPLFANSQVLKVTIHENKIIFHDLKITEPEEQVFVRVK
jgi:hypothetical protein